MSASQWASYHSLDFFQVQPQVHELFNKFMLETQIQNVQMEIYELLPGFNRFTEIYL